MNRASSDVALVFISNDGAPGEVKWLKVIATARDPGIPLEPFAKKVGILDPKEPVDLDVFEDPADTGKWAQAWIETSREAGIDVLLVAGPRGNSKAPAVTWQAMAEARGTRAGPEIWAAIETFGPPPEKLRPVLPPYFSGIHPVADRRRAHFLRQDRRPASRGFRALHRMANATPLKGEVVRVVYRHLYTQNDPIGPGSDTIKRWHNSPEGTWSWNGDISTDQMGWRPRTSRPSIRGTSTTTGG